MISPQATATSPQTGHRSGARRRLVGTGVAGILLTATLAGCSLDTAAFQDSLATSFDDTRGTLTGSSVPAVLEIPGIAVRKDLIDLEIQDDGALEVPDSGQDVGWYSPDANPVEGHPTVFVAHVDTPAGPAVFGRLAELGPGDEVEVTDAAGDVRVYRVDRVADHPVDDFPTEEVYGAVDGDEIRLLTCNGEFDEDLQQYEDNRVVFASALG